ncbi:hypothetical protein Niako_7196 [Niastella koreensis GR20-10]|uniref:Uncharacterized protein n=1 Tax=Niastella koreensis (strain DSM 17620 / KACC 11465 / NBRC 106392 / GR20-10) TaxID=700598 RepID=G8TA74_NIAKG|nr:hypothetical protein Niako_7196 [Niastella koreensis GR20-10]
MSERMLILFTALSLYEFVQAQDNIAIIGRVADSSSTKCHYYEEQLKE